MTSGDVYLPGLERWLTFTKLVQQRCVWHLSWPSLDPVLGFCFRQTMSQWLHSVSQYPVREGKLSTQQESRSPGDVASSDQPSPLAVHDCILMTVIAFHMNDNSQFEEKALRHGRKVPNSYFIIFPWLYITGVKEGCLNVACYWIHCIVGLETLPNKQTHALTHTLTRKHTH